MSPSLDSDDSDYIPKPKFQIDLYAGDTIIVEHDLFGTWSCHQQIYGIDARENKVDLNTPMPLTSRAKIQLVKSRRKNVNADHFRRIIPLTSCILHSSSIDGMDTSQRTLNRIKNSRDRAADVVTGAIRYAVQHEDGVQTQTKQELVSRHLFTSMKKENAAATVNREQYLRIRGGGGNDTGPATDQQEAIVAGPAAGTPNETENNSYQEGSATVESTVPTTEKNNDQNEKEGTASGSSATNLPKCCARDYCKVGGTIKGGIRHHCKKCRGPLHGSLCSANGSGPSDDGTGMICFSCQPPNKDINISSSLNELKVSQLKDKLRYLGMKVSGKKQELISRLLLHSSSSSSASLASSGSGLGTAPGSASALSSATLVEEPINNFEGISTSTSTSTSTTTSTSATTTTSTTKNRKNDEKALYAWIVNASVGNSLRFTLGSTRRKNMDILVKNLIDTNTGLLFTQTLSGLILIITISSKPSSAVIVPAVETKPPTWRRSEAKEYILEELMKGDSWIDCLVELDEAHNIPWSQTAKVIQREEPLFRQYDSTHFQSNLLRLVETVREDKGRGQWDQDALNKEKLKYPVNAVLIQQGYPRWNISSAKKMLEEDIKAKKYVGVLPRDLRVTRQEYIDFPLRIFRDRLYAEVRKQTGDAFWVHRRNKSMRKKSVEVDELAVTTALMNIG